MRGCGGDAGANNEVSRPIQPELLRWQVAVPIQGRFVVIRGGSQEQVGPMGQRTVLSGGLVQPDFTPAVLAQELVEDLVRHFLA